MSWYGDAYNWTTDKIDSGLEKVGLGGPQEAPRVTPEDQAKLDAQTAAIIGASQGSYKPQAVTAQGSTVAPIQNVQQSPLGTGERATAATVGASRDAGTGTVQNATVARPNQVAGTVATAPIVSQATNMDAARIAPVNTQYAAQLMPSAVVGAPNIGAAERINAAAIDPAALGQAQMAQGQMIDRSQDAQTRQMQLGVSQRLDQASQGNGPSAAAAMLQQGADRAIANQFALAKSNKGTSVGLANRGAAINSAALQQEAGRNAAILKAQEQQQATQTLAQTLQGARGLDQSTAQTQAQLLQQAGLQNAQLGTNVSMANAAQINQRALSAAQLQQQAAIQNQTAANDFARQQAQMGLQANIATADGRNQVNLAQGQLTQQAGLANQSAINTAALNQAQLTQQASQTNAGAANQVAMQGADLGTRVAQGNQDVSLRADLANQATDLATNTTNAQLDQAAQVANQEAILRASIANQATDLSTNTTNAQLETNVDLANTAAANDISKFNSAQDVQVQIANQNTQTQTSLTQAQLTQQAALANAANEAERQKILATMSQQDIATLLAVRGQDIGLQSSLLAGQSATNAANAQQGAAALGGLATVGVAMASDRRVKKNIKRSTDEISEFLATIEPYAFEYKDPSIPGASKGQRYGIMAQDLERSRVGKTLVSDSPTGKKVDVGQAAMAAIAALGSLNKRIDRIEAR